MKREILIKLLLLVFISFAGSLRAQDKNLPITAKEIRITDNHQLLINLLDSLKLKGVILVFNPQSGEVISNDMSEAHHTTLPASTFKIPNTIIALETGIVEGINTVLKWDGKPRRLSWWERDMDLRDAFHYSCVPCYQEIAREIGYKRMRYYLDILDFGNMNVSPDNIDKFWLEGESGISAFQQLDFMLRFYYSKLPVSENTFSIMKELMVIDAQEDKIFSGKSGWSIRQGNNTGWFTGYLEKGEETFFVVTRIEPLEGFNMDDFGGIRSQISVKALDLLF